MKIAPNTRPQIEAHVVRALLTRLGFTLEKFYLVGIRGYYEDSMGAAGKNDRAMYDDAIIVLLEDGSTKAFNANCDPSAYRRGIANLAKGHWKYKRGIHGLSRPKSRQYPAFVQAAEVTVIRDGGEVETGWFGINIHRGGDETTSSLGCQTIPPDQWTEFKSLVYAKAPLVIDYVLVEWPLVEEVIATLSRPTRFKVKVGAKTWENVRVSPAGRPSVPIRRFLKSLNGLTYKLDWDDKPILQNKEVPEWFMEGTESWAPVREVAELVGLTCEQKGDVVEVSGI